MVKKTLNEQQFHPQVKIHEYTHNLPFDNTVGADAFRDVAVAPEIEDVSDEFKESHCYKGITTLKGANVEIDYTDEMIDEVGKCANDVYYFLQNYAYIQDMDAGSYQKFNLYQYQKNMIKLADENRFTIFLLGRQAGKCVDGRSMVTVRNKKTGEVRRLSIDEFKSLTSHA